MPLVSVESYGSVSLLAELIIDGGGAGQVDQAGNPICGSEQRVSDPCIAQFIGEIHQRRMTATFMAVSRFGVEVDAMPGGFVCSGSMKGTVDPAAVKEAVAGARPLRKLFSKEQRAFFAEHAPEGVALDNLAVLGPIFVLRLKWAPKGFARRLVAELWLYPNDRRILELSTKCTPDETFQVAAETRTFLTERGVNLAGEQERRRGPRWSSSPSWNEDLRHVVAVTVAPQCSQRSRGSRTGSVRNPVIATMTTAETRRSGSLWLATTARLCWEPVRPISYQNSSGGPVRSTAEGESRLRWN